MRRFLAIFKKEFRQISRDPLSLGLLIFVPALLLILYGYALSFDVKHIAVAVLDHDRTPRSRFLLDSLFQNPYFDRRGTIEREADADALLARGAVRAVLVIPAGYASRLNRGEDVRVQALVDAADANTASTTIGYLEILADRITRREQARALEQAGLTGGDLPMVAPEPRLRFNPELRSAVFLVPGLIAMLLMLSAVIATALSIVREKEHETIEQILVSPVTPTELVLGKTLPYVAICLLTMVLILVLGYLLFGIVIHGSLLILSLGTLFFLFAALGMGVLISSVTRSQQVAFQSAIIASLLPSIILSGLIFPIANMPLPIKLLSAIVPPRYFVAVLRDVIMKGAPLSALWLDLLAMLALGLVFNGLAIRNTRKAL